MRIHLATLFVVIGLCVVGLGGCGKGQPAGEAGHADEHGHEDEHAHEDERTTGTSLSWALRIIMPS
jgi:hypothetical protein